MAKEPPITDGEIAELLDPQTVEQHIRDKYISRRSHPTLPLAILNYTSKCQFESFWDSTTIRCRGLIYDYTNGSIVSVPFAKFFNYDSPLREETFPENLPLFEPEVTKKLDGSLGVWWRYKDNWGVSTRGSFTSEQSKWATEWFTLNCKPGAVPKDHTPLFEVIYPENQIVVKYDFSGLVLIGCVDNKTGKEMMHGELIDLGESINCSVVALVKPESPDLSELTLIEQPNEEGFVATWHHEEGPPLKVKIKFDTYFRLHRLLTGTSPKRVWEYLKDGKSLEDLIENVPNHFKEWVRFWLNKMTEEYNSRLVIVTALFDTRPPHETRKEYALWATSSSNKQYASILFAMLDGNPYSDIIWKQVRSVTEGLTTFKTVEE